MAGDEVVNVQITADRIKIGSLLKCAIQNGSIHQKAVRYSYQIACKLHKITIMNGVLQPKGSKAHGVLKTHIPFLQVMLAA